MSIVEAIGSLLAGRNLSQIAAREVFSQIMEGKATDAQIGAYLIAQRMVGEDYQVLLGAAEVMRAKVTPVPVKSPGIIDTCGTGGDGSGTFNISTATALVAGAAGARVAKHGNRSVSSRSGSADVLQSLGVNLELDAAQCGRCVDEVGVGFLFAPKLHNAMKYAIGPRREIAQRTIFNLLGPLTNPAGARRQLMGVFAPQWTVTMAKVLGELGSEHVWVVCSAEGGLDEMDISGTTQVSEFRSKSVGGDGCVKTFTVEPAQAGLPLAPRSALAGGDPRQNAEILHQVLSGKNGHCRNAVLYNAAAALLVAGKAKDLPEGVYLAAKAIDSGAALNLLQKLVEFTQAHSHAS